VMLVVGGGFEEKGSGTRQSKDGIQLGGVPWLNCCTRRVQGQDGRRSVQVKLRDPGVRDGGPDSER
jgi:hypothetical protein